MIYEYKCSKCEAINEFWMKMSDPAPAECPACKGSPLERVISKTSFALKGTGWYTSDYKKSTNVPAKTDAPASPTTETNGSSCSDKS